MSLQPLSSFHSFLARITSFLEKSIDILFTQGLLGQDSVKTKVIFSQVSTREMGKIKNTLDDFFKNETFHNTC